MAKSKYKLEFCNDLIDHMAKGLSFEAFAGHCKVSRKTLYEWIEAHNEFKEAKELALPLSRLYWEKQAVEGLWDVTEFENGKPSFKKSLNTTLWIFNMKNRFGWRDKTEVESTVKFKAEDVNKMSLEQLKALVAHYLSEAAK